MQFVSLGQVYLSMDNSGLLKAIVQNAIDGIISIDARGIIESINPSACKLFGYRPDEVVGRNISVLMPPPDSILHDSYMQRYRTTHEPRIIGIGREVRGLRKDGSTFPLQLGVSEVKYQERTIFVGFIHDLTKQKEVEDRLKDYANHLEELVEVRTQSLNDTINKLEEAKDQISSALESEKELGKLKSRFLSMASHEFRTPLSTIQLSASLVAKYVAGKDLPEVEKHVGKIKSSVAGLTAILNNFLQLEKLDNDKIVAQLSMFSLTQLSGEIVEEMQLLANGKQTISYKHIGPDEEVFLDKNLIRNCIVNLMTNAIKYSGDDSHIDIVTQIDTETCCLSVCDNGIGIPDEDQKYLFEPFFRAHNTGSIPGTGLGLNIVARHVALLKGTIDFKSSPEGTTFTLTFPRR